MGVVETSVSALGDGLSRALSVEEEQRAVHLHQQALVVDTCGGIQPLGPSASIVEAIANIRAGGVSCVGLTLVSESRGRNLKDTMQWIVWWNQKLREASHDLVLVTSADEILQAKEDGRIAVFYLFQNGRPFEDELGYIEIFRQLGVTSSQLTYNLRNLLGDGHYEPGDAGLSLLGQQVVVEMNRVGMLVDLSHSGEQTQQDTLRASTQPVYFSHSNAYSVHGTRRNATDATLDLLGQNGGMINAMGLSVSPDVEPSLSQMIDHLAYCVDKLGEDHVGVASDCLKARDVVHRNAYLDDEGFLNVPYEGTLKVQRYDWRGPGHAQEYPWFIYPRGLKTYPDYVNVTRELVIRGLSDEAITKILGGNFLTLYRQVVG